MVTCSAVVIYIIETAMKFQWRCNLTQCAHLVHRACVKLENLQKNKEIWSMKKEWKKLITWCGNSSSLSDTEMAAAVWEGTIYSSGQCRKWLEITSFSQSKNIRKKNNQAKSSFEQCGQRGIKQTVCKVVMTPSLEIYEKTLKKHLSELTHLLLIPLRAGG